MATKSHPTKKSGAEVSDQSTIESNVIVIPLKTVLLHTTIGEYPQYETNRPMKSFLQVEEPKRNSFLNSIALRVIHIVIDPLDYNGEFLNQVKQKCVNAKRLTIDANLQNNKMYKKTILKATQKSKVEDAELFYRRALTFICEYDQIEELYFGSELDWIEKIYKQNNWGFGRRQTVNSKFCAPSFSSEILIKLNPNLKMIFFDYIEPDSYDLRDLGSRCATVIHAMKMSKPFQLEVMEGGPAHVCLNQVTNLRVLSTGYIGSAFHSDTLEELVLLTLSGDYKVHQMFPNLKKIRVKMFCPFVLDMSGTANAGLYDGVVIDELEVEEQIPCFCKDTGHIQSTDALLQNALYQAVRYFNPNGNKSRTDCICTDVASIEMFKTLKILKLRCFDDNVARFINKLQQIGSPTKIIIYEKSRFERNSDHHSVWNHLDKLAETFNIVPHDKIEIVMKKAAGKKLKKIKEKLSCYIPKDVPISFID